MAIENLHKLITREDPFFLHKGLAMYCLGNFIYRYYLLLTTGTMSIDTPAGIASVLVHGLLSCSSLIFHIPENRIKGTPMIYPEMRMHTIIFTLRSVACCISFYFSMSQLVRFGICFATMLAADLATKIYNDGNKYGSTIRNMPYDSRVSDEARDSVKLMNSQMQIGATLFMLGNSDSAFLPLFAIQMASFLGTLTRKGILSANMWHICYAVCLWVNIAAYIQSLSATYIIIQSVGYTVYTSIFFPYRTNKYFNWFCIFTLFHLYSQVCDRCVEGMPILEWYGRSILVVWFILAQVYKVRGLFFLSKV